MNLKHAILVLEDGTAFRGMHFGAEGETTGEVVFNTSITGYQEILTDPSYCGQMVVMTYPLIGNYGVTPEDEESTKPQVRALIVKEISSIASNWRANESLHNYLQRHRVMGLAEIDTRALVLHIRSKGAMRAILSTRSTDIDQLLKRVHESPQMQGADLVKFVTRRTCNSFMPSKHSSADSGKYPFHIVAYDFGMKQNILHLLLNEGFKVTVVPATFKIEDLESLKPDGIFLSNGPGDPAALDYIIEEVTKILHRYPTFGICLGHQLMGLALGGKTYKLKFGHRGANHPVRNEKTKIVEITSQNHGFAVSPESLNPKEVSITHWNLNDATVEGLQHNSLPCFSVQYHPEASPGPHDSHYLFRDFRELIQRQLVEKT